MRQLKALVTGSGGLVGSACVSLLAREGWDVVATLHAIEDWLALPYMQDAEALVKGPEGKPQIVKVTMSPAGDRDFYRKDSKVEQVYRKAGLLHRGKVGQADTIWMPGRELVAAVVEAIYQEPTLLLCDRADCEFCREYRQPTIDHVKHNHP